jgi:hypothetical protein
MPRDLSYVHNARDQRLHGNATRRTAAQLPHVLLALSHDCSYDHDFESYSCFRDAG